MQCDELPRALLPWLPCHNELHPPILTAVKTTLLVNGHLWSTGSTSALTREKTRAHKFIRTHPSLSHNQQSQSSRKQDCSNLPFFLFSLASAFSIFTKLKVNTLDFSPETLKDRKGSEWQFQITKASKSQPALLNPEELAFKNRWRNKDILRQLQTTAICGYQANTQDKTYRNIIHRGKRVSVMIVQENFFSGNNEMAQWKKALVDKFEDPSQYTLRLCHM